MDGGDKRGLGRGITCYRGDGEEGGELERRGKPKVVDRGDKRRLSRGDVCDSKLMHLGQSVKVDLGCNHNELFMSTKELFGSHTPEATWEC